MEITENNQGLDFAFQLFKGMQEDNLNYIYRGYFTQNITDSILTLTETNLRKAGESSKAKKRVYSILVECLQNITRHQDDTDFSDSRQLGIFIIQKKESKYFITTGNVIEGNKIEPLTALLEKINSFDAEELKNYYKEVLTTGELSDKGGAGLGLIEMARKSGNKLFFDFVNMDESFSYFYLHTALQFVNDELSTLGSEIKISLNNIINMHSILNRENILLIFNGVFDQESLLNLLSIMEGQMTGTPVVKKKIFYIMVEMLQNIVKHAGYKVEGTEGTPGLFFISETHTEYLLATGNYVENPKAEYLKNKLDQVNGFNNEELEDFYNKNLLDFEVDDSKKAGLGIIDLRIKSENKLNYDFYKIDGAYTFFTLQIKVQKE